MAKNTNMIHQPYANHTKTHTANAETHTASHRRDVGNTQGRHANHTQNTHTQIRQWNIHKNDTQTIRKTHTRTKQM